MNRGQALLCSLVLTAGFAFVYGKFVDVNDRQTVVVARILDGDTLQLQDGRTVRLLNINAPEKKTFAAERGTELLGQSINKSVEIEITGTEKYGRYLGRLYVPEYANLELVKRGFASVFLVDSSEKNEFYDAQQKAQLNGEGMWEHSPDYGCVESTIDRKEEFIVLDVLCETNVRGWAIKDESTKTYTIKKELSKKFTLHSGSGVDNVTDLFWNKGDVWNNDRDTLIIRDANGGLVHVKSYGY